MKTIHYLIIIMIAALANAAIGGSANVFVQMMIVIALFPIANRMDRDSIKNEELKMKK